MWSLENIQILSNAILIVTEVVVVAWVARILSIVKKNEKKIKKLQQEWEQQKKKHC